MTSKARTFSHLILASFLLAMIAVGSTAQAQNNQTQGNQAEVAGRVIMAFGKVYVDAPGKSPRLLKRRDFVYAGDRLVTRGSGYAQIRYRDGALMSIRPGTELRIDDYRFNGNQDGTEKGFFSVIKGGFRTITGLIGKKNKSNYRVSTPIATIGIRGTHYGMRVCGAGECVPSGALTDDGKPDASQAADPGLYVEVKQGATSVSNASGEKVFGAGQNFYVANQSAEAEQRLGPFGFVFDKYAGSQDDDDEQQETQGEGSEGGSEQGEQQSESGEGDNGSQQGGDDSTTQEGSGDGGESSDSGDSGQGDPQGAGDGNQGGDTQGDGAQSPQTNEASGSDTAGSGAGTSDNTGTAPGGTQGTQATSQAPAGFGNTAASPGTATSTTTSVSSTTATTTSTAQNLNVVADQSTVNTDTETAVEATVAANTRSVADGSIGLLAFTPTSSDGVVAGGRTDNNQYKLLVGDSTAGSEEHAVKQAQAIVSASDGGQFKSASATLAELNNLNGVIYYGRWGDNWQTKGVNDSAFRTGSGAAHFIYTESATTDAQLGTLTSTARFYLKSGAGSTPTDLSGNTGTMDHAAMEVNFGTGMVTGLRLDATVNNKVFTAGTATQTSFSTALFTGLSISGHCTSGCSTSAVTINGNAKIGFANNGGTANQALLAFGAADSSYTHGVVGTAVLEKLVFSDGGTGSVAILAYEIDTAGNNTVHQFHAQRVEDDGTTTNEVEITTIDGVGNIVPRTKDTDGVVWDAGLSKHSGDGGDTVGMNWGQWDKDWTHSEGGNVFNSQGTGHVAFTDKATSPTDLATAAGAINTMVTFNRIGGTSPTDGNGNAGTINAWQFNMDFSSAHYPISNYVFNATIAGKTVNVQSTGSTTYGDAQAGNLGLSGTCTGGCASTTAGGTAVVQLVGSTATHALSGVTAHDSTNADAFIAIGGFKR